MTVIITIVKLRYSPHFFVVADLWSGIVPPAAFLDFIAEAPSNYSVFFYPNVDCFLNSSCLLSTKVGVTFPLPNGPENFVRGFLLMIRGVWGPGIILIPFLKPSPHSFWMKTSIFLRFWGFWSPLSAISSSLKWCSVSASTFSFVYW